MDREASIRAALADHGRRLLEISEKHKAGRKITKEDLRFLGLEKEEAKAGRPAEGSQSLPVYGSMAACAAATGIPLWVIKQAKAEGCEAFRYGRIELAKLLLHFGKQFAHPDKVASSGGGDENEGNWRQVFDKYHAMREKKRYLKEDEALISKEEVRTGMAAGVNELYSTLDRVFCNELPPTLMGLSEIEIRNRCKMEINQMKDSVRKRFESFAPVQAAKVEAESSESSEDSAGL
jgi:hypothetical protein